MTHTYTGELGYDGQYASSQSDAYQVLCKIRRIHMTDQFSWSHWVRHIQVHLYSIYCLGYEQVRYSDNNIAFSLDIFPIL